MRTIHFGMVTFFISYGLCSTDTSRSHSHWGTWTLDKSIMPWDEHGIPNANIVPLTIQENSLREAKFATRKSANKGKTNAQDNGNKKNQNSKSKTRTYETNDEAPNESTKEPNLATLKQKALELGTLAFKFFNKEISSTAHGESRGFISGMAHNLRLDRREGEGGGGGDRGVIDWLARLIGVQGKTLGEFLREYQVHVLYDLVFTFFKWIFFLYAGLLIP